MWKVIAVLVVLYLAGFVIFVTMLPAPKASAAPAQGIVALTGGDERLSAAVNLLETNHGQRLLISGVHPKTTKQELKLLSHGGPRFDCCADLGYAAENTRGNAQEAADWARAHRFNSLIVVTASYHMPRSLTEFQAAMPGVKLEPYPVQPVDIDLAGWWHDFRALRVLQGEYAKYVASTVRNAVIRPAPPGPLDPKKPGGKSRA
ncbi:MAG: YdcF family protein [Alphaproteobacteria bacterium]|nr:YdcF family protein [Alphaproteobacteria bacterium]